MYLYHCVMEQLHAPEIGPYVSYGVAAFSVSNGISRKILHISDLSTDSAKIVQLAERCTTFQLEPLQLMDVAEDFLAGE